MSSPVSLWVINRFLWFLGSVIFWFRSLQKLVFLWFIFGLSWFMDAQSQNIFFWKFPNFEKIELCARCAPKIKKIYVALKAFNIVLIPFKYYYHIRSGRRDIFSQKWTLQIKAFSGQNWPYRHLQCKMRHFHHLQESICDFDWGVIWMILLIQIGFNRSKEHFFWF